MNVPYWLQILNQPTKVSSKVPTSANRCSIEKFIELTLFFKRQQHRKLSWVDKDSHKDQANSMNFSIEHML
jgi:hypothetical protein